MPNVMAALPDVGGAVCESSVIPFLVPHRELWLTPTARVPCSNATSIAARKTWTQSEFCSWQNSVIGQQPPKMYIWYKLTSVGDGQTSCKVWFTSVERRRCSNEAKTRSPLKLLGCPKLTNRSQPLVGRSSCCEGMWGRH